MKSRRCSKVKPPAVQQTSSSQSLCCGGGRVVTGGVLLLQCSGALAWISPSPTPHPTQKKTRVEILCGPPYRRPSCLDCWVECSDGEQAVFWLLFSPTSATTVAFTLREVRFGSHFLSIIIKAGGVIGPHLPWQSKQSMLVLATLNSP